MLLSGAQLLYLATRAGAEALGMEEEIGDFGVGKAADVVYLRAEGKMGEDLGKILTTIFTLGDASWVREVRVQGQVVKRRPGGLRD